jgi:hypothetical protein
MVHTSTCLTYTSAWMRSNGCACSSPILRPHAPALRTTCVPTCSRCRTTHEGEAHLFMERSVSTRTGVVKP